MDGELFMCWPYATQHVNQRTRSIRPSVLSARTKAPHAVAAFNRFQKLLDPSVLPPSHPSRANQQRGPPSPLPLLLETP